MAGLLSSLLPGMEEHLSGLSVDPAVRALVLPAFGLASSLKTVQGLHLIQSQAAANGVKPDRRGRDGSSAGGGRVVKVRTSYDPGR
jgi:hypothetical protein